jgi:hypothetical protein
VNVKKDKQSSKVKRSARTLPKKVDWVKQFMVTEYTISAVVFQMNDNIYRFNLIIMSIKMLVGLLQMKNHTETPVPHSQ